MVPILSYIASGGRARCCGVRVSPSMPMGEITLGMLFTLSYLKLGLTPALLCFLASLVFLWALVLYDFAHQILPSVFLAPFILFSSAASFFSTPQEFLANLSMAAILASSLALIHFLSRGRAMGFADAPFVFGCALLAGTSAFAGFLFSFWIGAVVGIIVLLRRPRGSRMGVEVPFAPFLAAGFLLAYFTAWDPIAFTAAFL